MIKKQNVSKETTNTQVYEVSLIPLPQQMFTFINEFNNTIMNKLSYLRTTSQAIHLTILIHKITLSSFLQCSGPLTICLCVLC